MTSLQSDLELKLNCVTSLLLHFQDAVFSTANATRKRWRWSARGTHQRYLQMSAALLKTWPVVRLTCQKSLTLQPHWDQKLLLDYLPEVIDKLIRNHLHFPGLLLLGFPWLCRTTKHCLRCLHTSEMQQMLRRDLKNNLLLRHQGLIFLHFEGSNSLFRGSCTLLSYSSITSEGRDRVLHQELFHVMLVQASQECSGVL